MARRVRTSEQASKILGSLQLISEPIRLATPDSTKMAQAVADWMRTEIKKLAKHLCRSQLDHHQQ